MKDTHRIGRIVLGSAVVMTAALSLAPAYAQSAGQAGGFVSKDEYQKLQKEHEQLMKEVQELKTQMQESGRAKSPPPPVAPEGGTSAEPGSKGGDPLTLSRYVFPGSTQVQLTGYGTAGFTALSHLDPVFQAQFNPMLLWKVSDKLLFEGELELELEDGETSTALEQAHLSYLATDWITFDAGKFLNPMNSFVERYHMAWVNRLPDKPLAVYDGLLPETYVGAQVRGGLPVGSAKVNYSAFIANAPKLISGVGADDDAGTLGMFEWDNFGNEGGRIATGGHVGFLPVAELELGYGLHYSGLADSRDHVLIQSVDLNYVRDSDALLGLFRLNAQWIWSQMGRGAYDNDGTPLVFRNNRNGGYAQVAYRPTKASLDFLRRVEGVVRYDCLRQENAPVGFDENRYTIGLNYWLTPKTVFKVAYQLDDKNKGGTDNSGVLVQFATGF